MISQVQELRSVQQLRAILSPPSSNISKFAMLVTVAALLLFALTIHSLPRTNTPPPTSGSDLLIHPLTAQAKSRTLLSQSTTPDQPSHADTSSKLAPRQVQASSELDSGYQLVRPVTSTQKSSVPAAAKATVAAEKEASSARVPAHWTYSNPKTGPYSWASLDSNYEVCGSGQRQSPIDLKMPDPKRPQLAGTPGIVQTDSNLRHILFNYSPSNLTLLHHDNVTHIDDVSNNGHTVQVNYESGSEIFIHNKRYDLLQFHFHSPSEHTLNSHHFDMEMHLVHQNVEDRSLAVVGLWLEVPHGVVSAIHEIKGKYVNVAELNDENSSPEVRDLLHLGANPFLDSLNWAKIPKTAGVSMPVTTEGALNIFDALPFDQGYITYEGSLTTPPCSEIVTWYVLKTPVSCSLAQKNVFLSIFGQNARPTQLIHGRNVTQTLDADHAVVVPSGISHDLFMGIMAALIIVSLLLLFAIIFICTRSQHKLGRTQDKKLYNLLSPNRPHQYEAINPVDDELENGNRYRATAQQQAQSLANQQDEGSGTARPPRPTHAGNAPHGGHGVQYGGL